MNRDRASPVRLAVVAVGVLLAGCSHGSPTPARGAPKSVQVDGEQVPYAGEVPWADAVADPRDPRRLTVMADGQSMRGIDICVLPTERPIVDVTPARVSILIAGYGRPLPAGVACGEPGRGPQRVRVTLPSALGHRVLVDVTTGLRHRVLDPAEVPNLHVPPGYTATPISWQERTGVATRGWSSRVCATGCDIQLQFRPPGSYAPLYNLDGLTRVGRVSINGSLATVDRYRERRGNQLLLETALTWTRNDHSRVALSVGGEARGTQNDVPTESQTISLARSVR